MRFSEKIIGRSCVSYGYLMVLLMLMTGNSVFAQHNYHDYFEESRIITNTGMYVLGTWAVANMVTGAYGWSNLSGEQKYFNQMNLFWNVVNLSIAGFSIYGHSQLDVSLLSTEEMLARVIKMENLLLINAALDVGYIGGGFLLRHYGKRSLKKGELLKGYGNSVILQGSFLLIFDLILYGVLNTHKNDFLNSVDLSFSPAALNLKIFF